MEPLLEWLSPQRVHLIDLGGPSRGRHSLAFAESDGLKVFEPALDHLSLLQGCTAQKFLQCGIHD